MIEIKSLHKSFNRATGKRLFPRNLLSRTRYERVPAVLGLDLDIGEGEFFSLLGPNGAGKTTTVRILCTLLFPDSGTCRVAGHDVITEQRAVRKSIGVSIRGERSVYWKLTGRQNLEYFASLYGIRGQETARRSIEVAESVGLASRLDDFVETYSMGMKQRLAIAASLIHRPPVLVLDEPTIGLDPNGARTLRTLLKNLCKEQGVTILYTTHYMQEAEELSDRLAIIHQGKKVVEGAPASVRAKLGDDNVVEITVNNGESDIEEPLSSEALIEKILHVDRGPLNTTVRARTTRPLRSITELSGLEQMNKFDIQSINIVRPSLEDVFISLTGSVITEVGDAQSA